MGTLCHFRPYIRGKSQRIESYLKSVDDDTVDRYHDTHGHMSWDECLLIGRSLHRMNKLGYKDEVFAVPFYISDSGKNVVWKTTFEG